MVIRVLKAVHPYKSILELRSNETLETVQRIIQFLETAIRLGDTSALQRLLKQKVEENEKIMILELIEAAKKATEERTVELAYFKALQKKVSKQGMNSLTSEEHSRIQQAAVSQKETRKRLNVLREELKPNKKLSPNLNFNRKKA